MKFYLFSVASNLFFIFCWCLLNLFRTIRLIPLISIYFPFGENHGKNISISVKLHLLGGQIGIKITQDSISMKASRFLEMVSWNTSPITQVSGVIYSLIHSSLVGFIETAYLERQTCHKFFLKVLSVWRFANRTIIFYPFNAIYSYKFTYLKYWCFLLIYG